MLRITITLNEQEKKALQALAEKEIRDPRAQAALIIRTELQRQGLIEKTNLGIISDDTDISQNSTEKESVAGTVANENA